MLLILEQLFKETNKSEIISVKILMRLWVKIKVFRNSFASNSKMREENQIRAVNLKTAEQS